MKILYIVLLFNSSLFSMMRCARPSWVHSEHRYSTVQIRISNPKLIASLEAAHKKMQLIPPVPAKRGA